MKDYVKFGDFRGVAISGVDKVQVITTEVSVCGERTLFNGFHLIFGA